MDSPLLPIAFGAFVIGALALDLGLLRRRGDHQVRPREAIAWTTLWVSLAIAFGALIWATRGADTALSYLTAYLIEWSLSIDNVFVIALIFSSFAIPPAYQHRAIVFGVLGALVMRFLLIGAGVSLVARFEWLLPLFGAFLLITAVRMLRGGHEGGGEPRLITLLRRRAPISETLHGERFTIRVDGRRLLTPLGLALISIEAMDLVFAVDSIPAALAISSDSFVIFSSNAFAILGLRSLYFLIAEARTQFALLSYSLAATIAFIGLKLIATGLFDLHLPAALSLGAVVLFIGGSIALSLLRRRSGGKGEGR
jgi:tellurite resistance protein TerC